jgi:hypothetical protein
MWNCHRSTDNRYSGDNRLIGLESSHRQPGLAPQNWGGPEVISDIVLAYNGGALRGNTVGSLTITLKQLSYGFFLLVTELI